MEKASKRLIEKWNRKLKLSGFTDIENADGSLKAEIDPRTLANAMQTKDIRENYQARAEEFLCNYRHFSSIDRKIWAAHCTGLGAVRISKLLDITMYKADTTLFKLRELSGLSRKK